MRQLCYSIFFLIIPLIVSCGKTSKSFFHEICRPEYQKIDELNLKLDLAYEVLKQSNEQWQDAYDNKVCWCSVQDARFDE